VCSPISIKVPPLPRVLLSLQAPAQETAVLSESSSAPSSGALFSLGVLCFSLFGCGFDDDAHPFFIDYFLIAILFIFFLQSLTAVDPPPSLEAWWTPDGEIRSSNQTGTCLTHIPFPRWSADIRLPNLELLSSEDSTFLLPGWMDPTRVLVLSIFFFVFHFLSCGRTCAFDRSFCLTARRADSGPD